MSYSVQYSPNPGHGDPYNRSASPFRAPSPSGYGMQQQQQQQPPPGGGQISAGTITYTTTTGPDGKVVYHPFKAVAASYQTAQGVVNGIQWVPAEATQILPHGAQPAAPDFTQSWNRPGGAEWQRDEEKRQRREEKEQARRDKERRKREKTDDRDLREARERERRASANIARAPSPYGPPPTSGRISPYANPAALPRPGGSPYHGGGALPSARPVSPYYGGGALPSARPVSPYYGGGALPSAGGGRPVSPYHSGGALPGAGAPVSAYHSSTAGRPVSPYHGGGALPQTAARSASPYYGAQALPGGHAHGPGYSQAEVERKMADLGLGGNNRQSADYGRRQRKVSTGGGYAAAPGGAYPNSSQYDTGAHAPPGGQQYPYSAASAASPNRAHSPMPNMDRQPGSPYQANRNSYAGGGHISRGPSPSPYGANPPGAYPGSAQSPNADQGMLPAPEGFSRPPNAAQSYTNFETMKIQDMEEFLEQIPRMPLVLVPHDVYHEDWIRLMTDLAAAWVGRLPIPEAAKAGGRAPKRTTVASDLIDLWNSSFFIPRGVEVVFYKGRERRSGRLAGQVDMDLPGFEDGLDDISDSDSELSENSDSDLDDPYQAGRYGGQGGAYGRQPDGQMAELREAKRRRKELEEDQRRKKREKKVRRRMIELERKYSVYLTCIPLPGTY